MGTRHVPELTFAIDRSEKMTSRMDELFGRIRKKEAKVKAKAAAFDLANPEAAAKPKATAGE